MERKLKITLIILIMILVSVIAFGGIYVKKLVSYNNIIPDYEFGSNLKGQRITTFKVGDHTHEVIRDADGNIVESIPEGADESKYTKEQVPENSEESKTKENYKKSKEIMINRLKDLRASEYEVRLNEENGKIFVKLADTDRTDTILSDLLQSGKFELVDSNDGKVLMTNEDIGSASVLYNTDTSGILVYLNIKFNKEGKSKINQISKEYSKTENEEGNEENNTEKKVTMKINGEEFLSTNFEEEIKNGELTITIGSETTDNDKVSEYVEQAQLYATILSNGFMPIEYEVETSEYMQSIYSADLYRYILLGAIGLTVLLSILYMIVRYKKLGILSSIVYIGTIAFIIIAIRYTRIEITLDTVIFGVALILMNTYINCKILQGLDNNDTREDRKGKTYKIYLEVIDLLIITLIISVVFTYNSFSAISSIGMLLFWGVIGVVFMNILFTRTLLIEEAKK